MRKNFFNNNGTRNITDFERQLFLTTQLNDFDSITVRDGYSVITYTREDIDEIGKIVAEEQYRDYLLSQGREAFETELERQEREAAEWEAYVIQQCELAEKQREGAGSNDAA